MPGLSAPMMNPTARYATVVNSDPRTNGTVNDGDFAKMQEAAQAFEAQYVFQLLELMAPEIGDDGLSGAGFAEETFRPQLHEAIAKQVVKSGGFGLSDIVLNELVASQEAAGRGPAN